MQSFLQDVNIKVDTQPQIRVSSIKKIICATIHPQQELTERYEEKIHTLGRIAV
jgi:hypothetical protein